MKFVKGKRFFVYYKRMSENTQQNSSILHTNSPWVYVIKACSNGCATYTLVCVIKFRRIVKIIVSNYIILLYTA